RALSPAARNILTAVTNRYLVPRADSLGISVGNAWQPIRTELDQRRGLIHPRSAIGRAGREVVLQAERVADLMRGELPQTRQHDLLHDLRNLRLVLTVGRAQSFSDHKILTISQRPQRNASLNSLSR